MAKNDDPWTRSPSRINLKIIFLQNYQFFMNYAKGPVKIHWLEAEKITFDPWSNFRRASFKFKICGKIWTMQQNLMAWHQNITKSGKEIKDPEI